MSSELVYELYNNDKNNILLIPLSILAEEYELLKLLIIDPEVNMDYYYNSGFLPTHSAVQYGKLHILKFLLEIYPCTDDLLESANYKICEYLLKEKSVDPNKSNAFFFAVQDGHIDIVKLLLEYNLSDYSIIFGLFTARKWGHTEIINIIENHLNNSIKRTLI